MSNIIYLKRPKKRGWNYEPEVYLFGTEKQAKRGEYIECFCYRMFKRFTGLSIPADGKVRSAMLIAGWVE
jgi:hypothetical protein